MNIETNVSLSNYTTMRLGGPASFLAHVTNVDELNTVVTNAKRLNQKYYVIGGGSNIIAHDEGFDGVIIRNEIKGFEVLSDNDNIVTIKAGAGEILDDVVRRTVEMGLSGIEALSAIPGTIGATPVQNVGAYGQEISDTLVSLEAYDTTSGEIVRIERDDCGFGYRDSIFRSSSKGRYIITSVTLALQKSAPQPPFYASLQTYLDQNNINPDSVQVIRDAVIAIRATKLPDPTKIANTGSFFKNALIESWQLDDLRRRFPDMPAYEMENRHYKVPSGWLIDAAELKGSEMYGMEVYRDNALVLVNRSATSYDQLSQAREEIISTVRDMFQIKLEQEPLELA